MECEYLQYLSTRPQERGVQWYGLFFVGLYQKVMTLPAITDLLGCSVNKLWITAKAAIERTVL